LSFDPRKHIYLGSLAEYHGFQKGDNNKQEYVRIRYAQGHCYALSGGLLAQASSEDISTHNVSPSLVSSFLLNCNPNFWPEDIALAYCLRRILGINPTPMIVSAYSVDFLGKQDRFNTIAYHDMDGPAQVSLARYLYGLHSLAIPAITDEGHQFIEPDLPVRPLSYLGDPNDFRRHDFLSNRGAFYSLWQSECFATGEVCGWKYITRSHCLSLGCCYKDDFPNPCMKPDPVSYDVEVSIRKSNKEFVSSPIIGQEICVRIGGRPLVTIVSTEMSKSLKLANKKIVSGIEFIIDAYINSNSQWSACEQELTECIIFETITTSGCAEIILKKDEKCIQAIESKRSSACKRNFIPDSNEVLDAFVELVKVRFATDSSSLRSLSSISLSHQSDFYWLQYAQMTSPTNKFLIQCLQYNPYLSESVGLLLCTIGPSDYKYTSLIYPQYYQSQIAARTVLYADGKCVNSNNKKYRLCYKINGELIGVNNDEKKVYWRVKTLPQSNNNDALSLLSMMTSTSVTIPEKCILQYDGELECFDTAKKILWSSKSYSLNVNRDGPFRLVVKDDSSITILQKNDKTLFVLYNIADKTSRV